ncbi:MAG: RsmB/NOP family class I SAM-dependent RNA methyltransferase, partial [Candidatus Didemnitutus sp.]|nr:RsmB/NOP family class I SAM-dependent RNA methyltransferase [Candidatus Didemnitutus sp.]
MTIPLRIAANQQRTFLAFLEQILPHVGRDSALPRRIKELLGRNRAIGSRDRRLYRELIYTTLRFLPWVRPYWDETPDFAAQMVAWLAPDLKDTTAYRTALLDGWPAVPPSLAEKSIVLQKRTAALGGDAAHAEFSPTELLPEWFREHCPSVFESPHLDILLARAPLWVRLQVQDRSLVLDEFSRRNWAARPSPNFPDAFALPPNAGVADSDAYRRGFVEIQDFGSQLVLAHAPIAAGQHWLDACAGAGGKSLQLAHHLSDLAKHGGTVGRVDATDIRPSMLEELHDRAVRARFSNIRIVATASGTYDGVLVDAPCSGSGTWRRLPHMKWITTPAMLAEFAASQLAILQAQAGRVKFATDTGGGMLVYATCSLSTVENRDVVAAFLAAHAEFAAEPPARDCG